MQGDTSVMFNDEFLLLSPDGYAYAEGARDILSGSQSNVLSSVTAPLSLLTALLVKILPFSFETVIFYMSTFFSSLIVIPVFFITKRFGSDYLAFGAAIFSSVVVSYYKRTMSGYYDTDMLIIVLPMFIYWFLIEALVNKNKLFALLATISALLFAWWLPSNIALNLSIAMMVLVYTLLFERKSLFNYFVFILLIVAALPLALILKVPILLFLYIILYFNHKLNTKITLYILMSLGVLLLISMAMYNEIIFNLILQKISYYFAKNSDLDAGMYFSDSGSFVLEVSKISYVEFATRVSGSMYILPLALIGYLIISIRHKIMIVFLPMLLLGAASFGIPGLIPSAGLRFSFYGTPVLAISLMYFIIWISSISKSLVPRNIKLRYILFILVLFPNINYIIKFQPKPILKNKDIVILDTLDKSISKDDYVISWWDYGYYLRYYSEVKTVSDGGRQLGKILYPSSYLFMSSTQSVSAKLAQMLTYEVNKNSGSNYLKMMMKTYNYRDPKIFLKDLNEDMIIPKRNKFDTYIYIPVDMLSSYGVIDQFSKVDLKSGQMIKNNKYFHITSKPIVFRDQNIIELGNGIIYMKDKDELYFKVNQSSAKVKKILTVTYSDDARINITTKHTGQTDGYTMIILDGGRVILANDKVMSSTLIQLGVLENYDRNLFEAITLSSDAKVYRVKRKTTND